MRLQLTIPLLLLLATLIGGPGTAMAQNKASTRLDVYADDWITVVAPSAVVSVQVNDSVTLDAGATIDVLSGATQVLTADMVSSATHFTERRYEGHVAGKLQPAPTWSVGGRYGVSIESDYRTHAAGIQWTSEVLERMGTLSVGYGVSLDQVGMSTDPSFGEKSYSHSFDFGWTQTLSRRSTLTALLTGQLHACGPVLGCQANPYRFVAVYSGDAVALALREHNPDVRARVAASLRGKHTLGQGFAVHAGYRFYGDSWAVIGNTGDLSLARGFLAERLIVRLDGRVTAQSAASFYRDRYTLEIAEPEGVISVQKYRTADRELSEIYDFKAGMRVETSFAAVGPFLRLGSTLRLAHIWYRYPVYSELPKRQAWVIGGGVYAEF